MKTPQQYDSLLGRLEADVHARIRSLFARCPTLHGFAVQDRAMLPKDIDRDRIPDADLFVTDIGLYLKIESHDEITTRSPSLSPTSCTTSRTPTIT
jgi:hypothetical protein